MPLSLPVGEITAGRLDQLLAAGYRRAGSFFYRTKCPSCVACQPLRLDVTEFRPRRSQRRAQKLGDRELVTRVGQPTVDQQRVELFNRHRYGRNLDRGEPPANSSDYRAFLLSPHGIALELSLWYRDQLIAISITDVGATSLSAVYCFFHPDFSWLSPGTYSIVRQIDLAKTSSRRWLYLGMYVADNRHLRYKARYGPHQRLIERKWQEFFSSSQK